MILGLHHFSIIASSEASVEFYKKLGFKETFRKLRAYDTVVLMESMWENGGKSKHSSNVQLEIFIDPNHPKRATSPENLGVRHLALRVESIEKAAEQLCLQIGPVMSDWVGIRFAFTADPDGLPIELREG